MAILMPYFKIAYYPIPKTACTSLKHTAFEINNGFYLKKVHQKAKAANNKRCSIHAIYKTEEFVLRKHQRFSDYTSFAVIRDPMERVLSAYSNRVLHHRALKEPRIVAELKKRRVPLNPDINEFIQHMEIYSDVAKQIMSHTRPLSYFLGDDLSVFDHVFTMRQMKDIAAFLSERVGRNIEIPKMQTGGKKQSLDALTDESFEKLFRLCEADYVLAKDYLPAPKGRAVA